MAFQLRVKREDEGLWLEEREGKRPVFIPHSVGPKEVQSLEREKSHCKECIIVLIPLL